jgi:RNA polymerase sigma-70 factor (ECF subfamily)
MNNPPTAIPDRGDPARTAPVEADRAVGEAWRAHHAELFAFLSRSTRDAAAAEDLLQDAFVRLTREARAGRMPALVRPWLFRVAGNLAISRARRGSTALQWMQQQLRREPRTHESPESRAVRRESSADIATALAALPPVARVALLLAADGFSGAEIAAAIGRSAAATRTLMCRARLTVRSQLASPGEES